jgi:hypothetical protein
VEHAPLTSAFGTPAARAPDFDAEFRLEIPSGFQRERPADAVRPPGPSIQSYTVQVQRSVGERSWKGTKVALTES